jgi:hypothetical protein
MTTRRIPRTSRNPRARLALVLSAIFLTTAPAAFASELVFQGQNAGLFPNANPSDTAQLMLSTVRPNPPAVTIPTLSPTQLVEQSVLGTVSTNITNQIFNTSNASGNFNLGGGSTISYTRANGQVTITFTDPATGTTQITVPDV